MNILQTIFLFFQNFFEQIYPKQTSESESEDKYNLLP